MNYQIQNVSGTNYIMIESGTTIHQIPVPALSSWGLLLGLTDPGEIIKKILTYRELENDSSENIWGPLYEALNEGLDKMSAAGVPPELMEILLDPEMGSPVPGQETLDKIATTQQESNAIIDACAPTKITKTEIDNLGTQIKNSFSQDIEKSKLEFIDNLAPRYELVEASKSDVEEV